MADSGARALVLSAGGFFGAWQLGAWSVLSEVFRPDMIVGASIGSLNGWALAGGATADELISLWLNLEAEAHRMRFRIPRSPLDGVLDSDAVAGWIGDLHRKYQPKTKYGVVLTELARLRPRLFTASQVTWRHLAASCAVLGVLRQYRIDGVLYTDGGLTNALPSWAAAEMGARCVLSLDCLPVPPFPIGPIIRSLRRLGRAGRTLPESVQEIRVRPETPLGPFHVAMKYQKDRILSWIEAGRRDASRVRYLIEDRFGAQ